MNRKKFFKALGSVSLVGLSASGLAKAYPVLKTDSCQTQRDAEGPYYKADAPARSLIETQGTKLKIEGKVLQGDDCRTPVANAILDVWHCDDQGEYDLKGFKCRGQLKTDSQGNYSFTTIFPPPYGGRPRHIHFKIRAKGFPELTTQLYFQGDQNIKNDFARNARKDRVIALADESDLKKGTFNIYL
ncbi:MAG: intradiol ring-cleavage dioxygenase [Marivirga sp.]|nr:intradiol ring-cleavage dioxygenase [Marivirga sp.]